MQSSQEQQESKPSLRHQDISSLIKHFSFTIQQRFQEIQKNCHYFTCLNSINYEKTDLEKEIMTRYSDYKTSNQQQIKLLDKFVDRLMQVFEFFRLKTQEPEILHAMGEKIQEKLKQILKNQINTHFFVNNRPKTHSTNVKPFANRSASNDFLSIVGPAYKQQIDLTAVFINNNKKIRTETTQQKKTVQVGKLFKYVFSVLKRGFLVKLRMEKPQKKIKAQNFKELSCIEESNTISVEGTCAIMRNCSQKGQKQGSSQYNATKMIFSSKEKINSIAGHQNKKQFYVYQKVKNRSASTNQYSFLSKQNSSVIKQSAPKLRQLEKKVSLLYDIMNIEKYCIVRVAKDPEAWKKDQLKRNSWIDQQFKKYQSQFSKWINKPTHAEVEIRSQVFGPSDFITPHNEEAEQTFTYDRNVYSQNCDQVIESSSKHSQIQGIQDGTCKIEGSIDFEHNEQHANYLVIKSFKTEQIQEMSGQQKEKDGQSGVHTLIVCSSRNSQKRESVLADKSSNLMDVKRSSSRSKDLHNNSVMKKQKNERKALRLNLPSMLGDKSNLLNEGVNMRVMVNIETNKQKIGKMSQKSQFYMQNYYRESSTLQENNKATFVPLLPKRDTTDNSRKRNTQNIYEQRRQGMMMIKRKNILSNYHPLNRCRIFREKKVDVGSRNDSVCGMKREKERRDDRNEVGKGMGRGMGMDQMIGRGKIREGLY